MGFYLNKSHCGNYLKRKQNDSFSFSPSACNSSCGTTSDRCLQHPSFWPIKPFFWQDRVETLGDTTSDQGYKNEALIVWMRTAAFPNFRKPYGLLDRSSTTQY